LTNPTQTSLELIEKLVSFDTTSRDSNLALIEFVSEYLSSYGIESQRVYNAQGNKASLLASVGPKTKGGCVLSAHTDVVPVDGQDWATEPFSTVLKNDRVFGRGTADMKSFPAVFLAMLPKFLEANLRCPIHLALSYDEEVGCIGVGPLIALIKKMGLSPHLVIIGEPTEMKVINRHKGVSRLRTTVTGLESHSAYTDRGVNAIFYASEILHFLHALSKELQNPLKESKDFNPPYNTIHVGLINGGTAPNIIPLQCVFDWEARIIPGSDIESLVLNPLTKFVHESILPTMKDISYLSDVITETIVQVPGLAPTQSRETEDIGRGLSGNNSSASAISFGTEAGLYQEAGYETIVCGPGSILQAHKPDEYIEMNQISKCEQFMFRVIDFLCRQ